MLSTLKVIAVDLDGPLLIDTFAPLLRKSCEFYGLPYTRELESGMLSRNRREAVQFMLSQFSGDLPEDLQGKSHEEMTAGYFALRAEYLRDNPLRLSDGAEDLLALLATLPVRLLCYGGLDEDYFRREMGEHADLFEAFICTNSFRPGMKEIVHDIAGVDPTEALFIDDVNFAATHARAVGTGFIGVPSQEDWCWQKTEMTDANLPFIVRNVGEIDLPMLQSIDHLQKSGQFWNAA
ncbi:HAD family hydrolase [Antarctobacter jejuensis]|uniref:HAD family hydrolase n=1 Tax=Antarctobacter jejuensis TaxID=1439938 RepID=UPI003FD65306